MERITRAAAVLGIKLPQRHGRPVRYLLAWLLVAATAMLPIGPAMAVGSLSNAFVSLSDPQPTNTANYTFTGSSVDGASTVKCVQVIWSTVAGATVAPTGFSGASGSVNAAASTLINSSSSGWSLAKSDGTSSTGQNNIYQYTNSTGVVPTTTTAATFEADGIVNSSTADTAYFVTVTTYDNTNCTSSLINNATVTYINTAGSTLSLTINPTLSFAVGSIAASQSCDGTTTTQASTSTSIPFGNVTSSANGVVCQSLAVATNATNGYTVYARYTAALSNGSNSLADLSGSNASPVAFPAPGTEAYGYTTDDSALGTGTANRFTNGGQKWAAMTTSNAEVAYEPTGVSSTSFNIGHQVGISTITYAGTYTTTIIYTCTPIY
ncbi:MAG TPA: hypothetical protein VMS08_01095 [Candidatus Saccharimonadia bacterium]|nr:hypothetical protein [Candidatus Saccharimonadia bacterium]